MFEAGHVGAWQAVVVFAAVRPHERQGVSQEVTSSSVAIDDCSCGGGGGGCGGLGGQWWPVEHDVLQLLCLQEVLSRHAVMVVEEVVV